MECWACRKQDYDESMELFGVFETDEEVCVLAVVGEDGDLRDCVLVSSGNVGGVREEGGEGVVGCVLACAAGGC